MDIYQAIISNEPVWIEGGDFIGLNYGTRYGEIFQEGHRKIVLSGNAVSYFCLVPEQEFPQNAHFHERPAYMSLSEASHVGEYHRMKTSLNLENVITLLKARKVKF